MRFSARYAVTKGGQALILEDAPRPTRIGFIKGVLTQFVGNSHGAYGETKEPLETHDTHKAFIALIRDESDPWDYDQESSWAALSEHLKACTWLEFYDFVELIGKLLIEKDDDAPFDTSSHFPAYQAKLNLLLQEDGIGWSLNDKAELHRLTPKSLATRVAAAEAELTDRFGSARAHYQKAVRYLNRHPIDEANSIKEIVSALEAVCRVFEPKALTLGDAIKKMRNDQRFAPNLLDSLDKLYAYSNTTPMVRHGHVKQGVPPLHEAELALFMGVAFIRYLIASGGNEPTSKRPVNRQ